MNSDEMKALVDRLDELMKAYLAELSSSSTPPAVIGNEQLKPMVVGTDVSPPTHTQSASESELSAIGVKLGNEGGLDLMREVHAAYEAEHGERRARTLAARWNGAAEWFD